MKKQFKIFVPVFFVVGIASFFLYYIITGEGAKSFAIGMVGGVVIGAIIGLAVPFMRNRKKRKSGKPPSKKKK